MDKKLKNLTFTALLAAMITVFTAYICHIPVGSNGGYIHFGDSLIYIAASLLPWPYAMAAAAIGGGLADILTAPIWAPATIIIKALISIPFTNKSSKIVTAGNVISTIIAFVISATGYACRSCYHADEHTRCTSCVSTGQCYTKWWKCYNIYNTWSCFR